MAETTQEAVNKQKHIRYLRALFNLDSTQRILEQHPEMEHHQIRHREASRDLLEILLEELGEKLG